MMQFYGCGINYPRCKEDCYWYGEWQDMNAHIPYCKCKNTDSIEPKDCENCEQYHSKYKPSNADHIRAMSDEELAYFMANIEPCRESAWLEWLKQEASE